MSANATPVIVAEETVVATKTRTPSLPAKYGKFIQFIYYLTQTLEEGIVDKEALLAAIHMFGSVQEQQDFVQRFFDASKDVNKEFRKLVLTHKRAEAKANKPPRAPRAKKVKPAAESEVENSDVEVAPKPKGKGRGKKAAASLENDFVAEIVSLAQGADSLPNQGTDSSPNPSFAEAAITEEVQESLAVAAPQKKEKVVKEKVVKEKKEKADKPVKEKADKPVKEKKEKKEKPQKATPTPAELEAEAETEVELEVEPFQLNGVDYLLDDAGFLYHPESFDKLGSLSSDKLSLIPL